MVQSSGDPRRVSTNLTAWADEMQSVGREGQLSIARYHADLATGQVGTFAYGSKPDMAYIPGAVARVEAGFFDTLHFTIPAGHYPDGLTATLRGRVQGGLTAVGRITPSIASYANQSVWIVFAAPGGSPPGSDYRWNYGVTINPEQSPRGVSEVIELTTWLALPGDTYPLPRTRDVSVSVRLEATASAAGESAADLGTEACADFGGSAQLLAVEAPPGVSWSSDSGVFLARSPAAAPRLFIQLVAPGTVALAWSTNHASCTLERTACLPATTWSSVTNAVTLQDNQFVVVLPVAPTESYFRLRAP